MTSKCAYLLDTRVDTTGRTVIKQSGIVEAIGEYAESVIRAMLKPKPSGFKRVTQYRCKKQEELAGVVLLSVVEFDVIDTEIAA